ncbi:MAG TPA: crotonase/enoyl-CoA hydratase family protein [Acidimicrobiales bacterium]|nr:crotonase/enoyl-CoA hydratase family protein [Acidimicrobiales bacterium]
MEPLARYELEDAVATITMDDGKVNALSPAMLAALGEALDRAADDRAVVVLRGRAGTFSAGFHLPTLRAGGPEAVGMIRGGFELAERLLSFPTPVVVACTGHAVAMASFVLLAGDLRIGAAGEFRIQANEVAIGLTMPRAAIELCRQRLTPAAFSRAVLLSEPFTPDQAVDAGFLDRVVDPSALDDAARSAATALTALDLDAHRASKLRAREGTLQAVHDAIAVDAAELAG